MNRQACLGKTTYLFTYGDCLYPLLVLQSVTEHCDASTFYYQVFGSNTVQLLPRPSSPHAQTISDDLPLSFAALVFSRKMAFFFILSFLVCPSIFLRNLIFLRSDFEVCASILEAHVSIPNVKIGIVTFWKIMFQFLWELDFSLKTWVLIALNNRPAAAVLSFISSQHLPFCVILILNTFHLLYSRLIYTYSMCHFCSACYHCRRFLLIYCRVDSF